MAPPRTGNDKMMRVRITARDWDALRRLAEHQNTTASEIVRQSVRRVVTEKQEELAQVA